VQWSYSPKDSTIEEEIMRLLAAVLVPAILIGGLAAVACGDDGGDANGGGSATATRPAATQQATPEATQRSNTPAAGGSAETIEVTAEDFSFSPDALDATAGQAVEVELTNDGSAPHTLTVYEDEDYATPVEGADTGTVSGGESGSFSVTFDEAKYYFRCEVHPTQMQGEINVQ
jgi:plastocyanin